MVNRSPQMVRKISPGCVRTVKKWKRRIGIAAMPKPVRICSTAAALTAAPKMMIFLFWYRATTITRLIIPCRHLRRRQMAAGFDTADGEFAKEPREHEAGETYALRPYSYAILTHKNRKCPVEYPGNIRFQTQEKTHKKR